MTAIYSCKKENTDQAVKQQDEMMVRSKKVVSLIKQFDEKMNSNLKTGELIDLDSAVWNMEALQNYDYAYPDSSTKDFVLMKSHYSIAVDANNKVLMSDVQVVNGLMEDTLIYQLSQFPEEVKCMKFWDVALDSVVSTTAYLSATGGFGFNLLIGTYWGFDEDDDWLWGTLGQEYGDPPVGKCDGTQVGVSDGSDELQWRLNNPALQLAEPYIFTDLETHETTGFEWETGGVYQLYVGWDYPEDNCLTNDTLTYYLLNSHDIINTYDYEGGLRPPTKSFANVEIKDELLLLPYDGQHLHYYTITYGTITLVGLPD